MVDAEFDEAKDAINRRKHGISLAVGLKVISSLVGEVIDDRRDYGEVRINAYGLIDGRLFACTYTRRGRVFRIISVRKANRKEQMLWLS